MRAVATRLVWMYSKPFGGMLSQECIHVPSSNSIVVRTALITNNVPRYVCSAYVHIVVLLRAMYCPPKFLYAYEWFFCIHRNHTHRWKGVRTCY